MFRLQKVQILEFGLLQKLIPMINDVRLKDITCLLLVTNNKAGTVKMTSPWISSYPQNSYMYSFYSSNCVF